MNNSPIDEYNFWKNLIEDKQDASQVVPDRMFKLLALAEMKMTRYLIMKHRLSGSSEALVLDNIVSIDLH